MWKSILDLFGNILEVSNKAAGTVKEKPIVTATSVIGFVVAILGLLSYLDSRYASAADLASAKQTITAQAQTIAVQAEQTGKILDLLKMQALSRKTILEMKQASGKITPEEKVELQNLKEMLKSLDSDTNKDHH